MEKASNRPGQVPVGQATTGMTPQPTKPEAVHVGPYHIQVMHSPPQTGLPVQATNLFGSLWAQAGPAEISRLVSLLVKGSDLEPGAKAGMLKELARLLWYRPDMPLQPMALPGLRALLNDAALDARLSPECRNILDRRAAEPSADLSERTLSAREEVAAKLEEIDARLENLDVKSSQGIQVLLDNIADELIRLDEAARNAESESLVNHVHDTLMRIRQEHRSPAAERALTACAQRRDEPPSDEVAAVLKACTGLLDTGTSEGAEAAWQVLETLQRNTGKMPHSNDMMQATLRICASGKLTQGSLQKAMIAVVMSPLASKLPRDGQALLLEALLHLDPDWLDKRKNTFSFLFANDAISVLSAIVQAMKTGDAAARARAVRITPSELRAPLLRAFSGKTEGN